MRINPKYMIVGQVFLMIVNAISFFINLKLENYFFAVTFAVFACINVIWVWLWSKQLKHYTSQEESNG